MQINCKYYKNIHGNSPLLANFVCFSDHQDFILSVRTVAFSKKNFFNTMSCKSNTENFFSVRTNTRFTVTIFLEVTKPRS